MKFLLVLPVLILIAIEQEMVSRFAKRRLRQ